MDEKTPDTIAHLIVHNSVTLESRYRKSAEFEIMTRMVDRVINVYPACLVAIFCDSKAEYCYTLRFFDDVPPKICRAVGWFCERVALERYGGHNGIWLRSEGEDDRGLIEPRWLEGETDYADPR